MMGTAQTGQGSKYYHPTKESTMYTALCFAKDQILKSGQSACPVTFDHPLYIKASEIIAASPELKTCLFTRFGGLHLNVI